MPQQKKKEQKRRQTEHKQSNNVEDMEEPFKLTMHPFVLSMQVRAADNIEKKEKEALNTKTLRTKKMYTKLTIKVGG
jgi:hypothetical protein